MNQTDAAKKAAEKAELDVACAIFARTLQLHKKGELQRVSVAAAWDRMALQVRR